MAGMTYGILAGYDGSAGSEQALRWATREAKARGTSLTVCLAWAPDYLTRLNEPAVLDLAKRSAKETLARGLRYAEAVLGPGNVVPLLADGPAAHVLCEHSAGTAMVVVGSRGHGGLAGSLLGSVSSQVAAHARGRIVVVRGHWHPAAGYLPGPVVVGVDGSKAAQAAMDFAVEEAALREVPLLAVCALADKPASLGGAPRLSDEFDAAMARCEKDHPEVTILRQVAGGHPRVALLSAALDAQMLVVGSRGRGGIADMLLGSVSQAMAHHAPCPVGVVHPR